LKLVKFSSSIERKQTVLTRTAEQQTVKEKKPVIDYEKVEASFLQNQLGQLNQTSMETLRLAGYTDVEEKSLSLDPIHHEILAPIEASRAELIVAAIESAKETFVGSIGRARSERSKKEGTRGHLFHVEILAPTEDARAESIVAALENAKETLVESVRRTKSKEAKKKKDDANKRVVLLTRHIRVLEAHKKKLPTGYYKADNAKGDVLGSLCSVFSIPAKKMDGTPNKADDKRLAIREILGAESPRTAFDSALEDLKQQLVCAKKGKQDEMAKKGNRDDLSATRKKKGNSKKRAVWLTKHISVLEVHKTKLPTGYWMAENAKGGVLGSLCSIFSIPVTKNDGTSNNADDKRLAIRKILGAESPRTVFDDALEDLKQQLVSEMITAAS
jgi:ribosome-associated translation inhibitor RaiA